MIGWQHSQQRTYFHPKYNYHFYSPRRPIPFFEPCRQLGGIGQLGMDPVCPDVKSKPIIANCVTPTGSVEFKNMSDKPLYVALMKAEKSGSLKCYNDAGFLVVPLRPRSDPLMSKWKLNYCRWGSGDLYLVWWRPGTPQPISLRDATPKYPETDGRGFKSISIDIGWRRGTLELK